MVLNIGSGHVALADINTGTEKPGSCRKPCSREMTSPLCRSFSTFFLCTETDSSCIAELHCPFHFLSPGMATSATRIALNRVPDGTQDASQCIAMIAKERF